MLKEIVCSECGAKIVYENGQERETCNYCGSFLDLSSSSEVVFADDVKAAARDAISFKNSLVAEINGNQASIADMWDSLIKNPKITKEQLLKFYKSLRNRIIFCIDAYKNMSDNVKYEVGDFICSQMQSIINFRIKNYIGFLEELDEIDALINKQFYEMKARGIFQIKAILVIWKRIRKIRARRSVLYYDYVVKTSETIISEYNSKIEPLKSELNATAMSAFGRRKALKEKIDSLELSKKTALDAIGMKMATRKFNRAVKKFKIEHVEPATEEIVEYIPVQKTGESEEAKIDYSAMTVADLIDGLLASINTLSKGVTRSETDNCKTIKSILEARSGEISSAAKMYFDTVMMQVNMIFANEHPAVMDAMIKNVIGNIMMQAGNLKNNLDK